MELNSIIAPGPKKKARKRIGRGQGSGSGKTSGRGENGQKSRSGASSPAWFEGGQMPLQRRLPKRGFKNFSRITYQVVNMGDLKKIEGSEINGEVLQKHGLIRNQNNKIKLLGEGNIPRKINVKVDAVSKRAREKIEKEGGKIEIINNASK